MVMKFSNEILFIACRKEIEMKIILKKIVYVHILFAFSFNLIGCVSAPPSLLGEAYYGDMAGVVKAVEDGKDVNKTDTYGYTALMYAAKYNYYVIAEYLLENGANPNLQNDDGQTALIMASMYNYVAMAKLLLSYNANVELEDKTGSTATIYAMINNCTELHEMLISASE